MFSDLASLKRRRGIARALRVTVVAAALLISELPKPAFATTPMMYDDVQLAHWPVIVIGYWPKAEMTPRDDTKGNVTEHYEAHTRLVVTKVIQGNLALGNHHLLLGGCIGWGKDGKGLNSATSTLIFSDVEDVSKPCIWFLEWAQSWDKSDRKWYLMPRQFQCVQNARLLPYYRVLRRKDRDEAIGSCLADRDEKIVDRALHYVYGYEEPWPLTPFDELRMPTDARSANGATAGPRRLRRHLPAIEKIVDGRMEKVRPLAVAEFAAFEGKNGIPKLRRLLGDRNFRVAGIAAGYLVRYGDKESLRGIASACRRLAQGRAGYRDPYDAASLACEICTAAGIARNPAYVPLPISLLEDDMEAGSSADIKGIYSRTPALYADKALKRITGVTFPFDVSASSAAWAKYGAMKDKAARADRLIADLGRWDNPLAAEYWAVLDARGKPTLSKGDGGDNATVEVQVTNMGDRTITIANRPDAIDYWYSQGGGGGGTGASTDREGFVAVAPGRSHRFKLKTPAALIQPSSDPIFRLEYGDMGRRKKAKAWIGWIAARLRTESKH